MTEETRKWHPGNVLPEYKVDPNNREPYGNMGRAYEPWPAFAAKGACAAVPGLSPCPWCDADGTEVENYLVVCSKNPEHVFQWTCWGG